MKTRTVIIVGGLALAGFILLGVKKVLNLKAVFDQMKIWPSKISNFKISLTEITFDLDFMLQNPTNQDFSVSGASIVKVKRVSAYRNGTYIGQADVNLAEINIPANSTIALPKLPFKISLQSLLDNLATIDFNNVTAASLLTGLTVVAVVDVLGAEYVIEG